MSAITDDNAHIFLSHTHRLMIGKNSYCERVVIQLFAVNFTIAKIVNGYNRIIR